MEAPVSVLYVWDTETGNRLFEAHVGESSATILSPDGRWMAIANKEKTLRVWRID